MKTLIMPLTDPVGAIWALMLASMVFWMVRRQWRAAITMAVPVLLLWLGGTSMLPMRIVAAAERPYARPMPQAPADAVLVLGGGYYASPYDVYGIALAGGASRVLMGMELARLGIATNLVVGGSIPEPGMQEPVASKLQAWVKSWNPGGANITHLGHCSNTRDEVMAFKKMSAEHQWKRVYLVTSALHMPRSLAAFKKEGIPVEPVGCDFRAFGTGDPPFQVIPSVAHLGTLSAWMHEQIGWWVYRLKGWI